VGLRLTVAKPYFSPLLRKAACAQHSSYCTEGRTSRKDEQIPHSATVSPPIALVTSLYDGSPLSTRELKPGCLTPNAAPNILLPGSPILGALCSTPSGCRLVARMAGSVGSSCVAPSPREELIKAFNVGWEGRLGKVGECSRPELLLCGGSPFAS
jgi:hypothetical protein